MATGKANMGRQAIDPTDTSTGSAGAIPAHGRSDAAVESSPPGPSRGGASRARHRRPPTSVPQNDDGNGGGVALSTDSLQATLERVEAKLDQLLRLERGEVNGGWLSPARAAPMLSMSVQHLRDLCRKATLDENGRGVILGDIGICRSGGGDRLPRFIVFAQDIIRNPGAGKRKTRSGQD